MERFVVCLSLLFLLYTGKLFAQSQGQSGIDSLKRELPGQKEDTNKVKLLNEICLRYSNVNPDEGIKYGLQGLELATRIDWKEGMGWANSYLAGNYQSKSDLPKALELFFKAFKISEASGNKRGAASATCNIANVYNYQSNYTQALDYYFKALKMDEEFGYKKYAAIVTNNIGTIYMDTKDYPKALEYFFKAMRNDEELGSKQAAANVYGNIGNVYNLQSQYEKALEYFLKSIKTDEELGNIEGIAKTKNNIGQVYAAQKNYAAANEYYQEALILSRETGARDLEAYSLTSIGKLYIVLDTTRPGAVSGNGEMFRKSYLSVNAANPIPGNKTVLRSKAIGFLQQGLSISKEIGALNFMQECYEGLAELYRLNGDYKSALVYANNFRAIRDSVFSRENTDQILKLGMQNDYDQLRLADSLKALERAKITAMQLHKQKTLTYLGIAGVLLLAGFSFFIIRERGKSEKERGKSDALLLNILPGAVADELKANGTTTARQFDNVTVLFTDFVDFTSASERIGPESLINELHNCFKAFDEITHKYGIEKIKTIGDAYLAVSGVPKADPKHAEHVIKAAMEINAFMQDRRAKLGEKTFEVRIGIHSGSVVAGIVGVKKFAYDIWGDTVNTAARMEQHSEAGKINISGATHELVKDKFTCVHRGKITVKGKGDIDMYFVV